MVKILVLAISVLTVGLVAAACSSPTTATRTSPTTPTDGVTFDEIRITIFKSPLCDCCQDWSDYLEEQNFQVKVIPAEDLSPMYTEYQIPQDMDSCHIALIEDYGYFVVGHVPVSAIGRMLNENPDIAGIALPGMPAGSPGMSGVQTESFTIYALSDGVPSAFVTIIK
jgi:hypothetical protein